MEQQKKHKHEWHLVWMGLIGSTLVAVCCFTPLLGLLLGVLGLGTFTGYLDYVLLPAMAIFVGIALYAVFRQGTVSQRPCCVEPPVSAPLARMRTRL